MHRQLDRLGLSLISGEYLATGRWTSSLRRAACQHGARFRRCEKRSFSRRLCLTAAADLYVRTRTYNDGKYQAPPFEMLETK